MSGAPPAPGRLGERLDPADVEAYLAALDVWVRERRDELDEIDAVAAESGQGAELTGDLMLSLALWKAVADRQRLLLATWDGGRAGGTERERLSVLIWGRLDATFDQTLLGRGPTPNLAVSLPEACRLSDALAHQLRARLALDPAADANARVLKGVRAAVERLRDQAALEPDPGRSEVIRHVEELAARADELAARLKRGGDIGGLVGPLENEAARLERDLIVGGAQRRDAQDRFAAADELRADLVARGAALRTFAAKVVEQVSPAPRQAVPDVSALGPVPASAAGLAAYRTRLDRVAAALNLAHDAYAAALGAHSDLCARLEASIVRAGAAGVTGDPEFAATERLARKVLARKPSPIRVALRLVEAHESWVEWSSATAPAGPGRERT